MAIYSSFEVIKGGKTVPPDGPTTLYDDLLELIFQVLPADTYTQITTRVNGLKSGAVRYHDSQVKNAIVHLRRNAKIYDWTIPHARRGNNLIKDKFFAVIQNRDGSWHIDPGMIEKLHEGNRGTLLESATKCENQAMAFDIAASMSRSHAEKGLLRRLAREQRHQAEQIRELYGDMAVS